QKLLKYHKLKLMLSIVLIVSFSEVAKNVHEECSQRFRNLKLGMSEIFGTVRSLSDDYQIKFNEHDVTYILHSIDGVNASDADVEPDFVRCFATSQEYYCFGKYHLDCISISSRKGQPDVIN
ncbi:MAG: hypothetical protein AAGB04_16100, partial [Pseudomonadota bacterium]